MAVGGTFLFALKSIFIKLAFGQGADPVSLLTVRMVLSAPFYLAVWWYLRCGEDVKSIGRVDIIKSCLLGFLGYYLASYLDLLGLALISAQLERLTLFTYPALVAVLAWMFLGEKLNGRIVLAIAVCYVGLFLMYSGERLLVNTADVRTGVLLVMGAALSYSFYVIFAKPTIQKIGSREFTSLAMLGSTFFVLLHFFNVSSIQAVTSLPPVVYGYGVILAFVCTVLPSFMINEAIARIGATRTTVIGSAGPVLTMALAILLLGEESTPRHLLGMAVAIAGVSLVGKRGARNSED